MQPLWQNHLFICCNQRDSDHPRCCCGDARGSEIRSWFKEDLKKYGLLKTVRANRSGCLEACEAGPAVVVYPDGIWYKIEAREDVTEIVKSHLKNGTPVQRLMLDLTVLPAWKAQFSKG